jgi:osmotically-inducible protein OsmY
MKLTLAGLFAGVLILGIAGCSAHDQEVTKREVREDAQKAKEDAKRAGRQIKEDARNLSERVNAAVQPDTQSASDKLANGADRVKNATSRAGVKLDHATLLAKVKAKLASDAGLSTLTKIQVDVAGSVVTLSGTVSTDEQKKSAEAAASQVEGVTRVHNSLNVQP